MGDKDEALLAKAEAEEKACNWVEAAELYEQVASSFSNEKKRLVHTYSRKRSHEKNNTSKGRRFYL